MKSLPKVYGKDSPEQFQTWTPSQLCDATPPTDKQMEQVLAIFRNGKEEKDIPEDNRLVLHRSETGQDFRSWIPGEMMPEAITASQTEWLFLDSAGAAHREIQQPQRFEFKALEEVCLQEKQEEEASEHLEQARLQAQESILAAQAEADAILLQAQQEITEQKKEAYQLGRNQATKEFAESLKAAHAMVAEVNAWKTELLSQGEQILLDMLVEIAQKMFGDGVELDPNALQINLNRVMENAQNLGDLNIFLNPQDAKALDPSWSEYQMLVSGDKVRIIPSAKITRGGCFVKGSMGSVDGRVETQLSVILKTFEEASELAE